MTGAHVLVARLDNAGDVLLTGPAVRAIAAGAGRVTFLAGPAGAEAARSLPGCDGVMTFDAPWVGDPPAPFDASLVTALVEAVRAARPDRALVFTSSHQSPLPLALVLRAAGVPWIGAICRDYPGSLLDLRVRPPRDVHEVERALVLASAAGYRLPPGDDGALMLRPGLVRGATPIAIEPPYVVVHPGASVPARAIPRELARESVDALVRDGWRVVVTGDRRERVLASYVAGAHERARSIAGDTDFATLARVLHGAAAVVTGNTGPAHLAAAVGTPVVSIFAPVVPAARWRPWGVPHLLLGDQDVRCAGCRARACPVPGQPCTGELAAADVCDAVRALAGIRAHTGTRASSARLEGVAS